MNEKFTINDMIEFYESELDYHTKKSDERLKCFTENKLDRNSYMQGNHNAFKVAYQMMIDQLTELKKSLNMNEKIEELIDWCQTETDACVETRKNPSYSSQEKIFQSGKKMVLDAVKDKLCSIYDEATNEGDLAYCDDFLCSRCGIHLTDWFRMDAKEDDCYEYEFKFCPNCGAKIVNHD